MTIHTILKWETLVCFARRKRSPNLIRMHCICWCVICGRRCVLNGAGLAAPQIGVDLQVVVFDQRTPILVTLIGHWCL